MHRQTQEDFQGHQASKATQRDVFIYVFIYTMIS